MADQLRDRDVSAHLAEDEQRGSAPAETDQIQTGRRRWEALVCRIAAGDESACGEFRSQYQTGVRVMLKRTLGSMGLEALVEETLSGALAEIRRGKLRQPGEFAQFLRMVVERQQLAAANRQPNWAVPAMTTMDRIRLRDTARAIERALMSFTKRERDILVGYFSRGLTRHDLECTYGATEEELDTLRMRLQDLIHPHQAKRRLAQQRAIPVFRRTAAVS